MGVGGLTRCLFCPVGGSLHDPGGVHEEQSDRHLLRLVRRRRRSGRRLPAALVRPPRLLLVFCLSIQYSVFPVMMEAFVTHSFYLLQVHAARRRRRLPSAEPQVHRPRGPLLFLLRLLHQVRLRSLPRHFHSQFRVSRCLNTHTHTNIVNHSKRLCQLFIKYFSTAPRPKTK